MRTAGPARSCKCGGRRDNWLRNTGTSFALDRMLASLEPAWGKGHDVLMKCDVQVIDKAGLIGTRQLKRVLEKAEAAGAKVVLVGDYEQLQAIEAGRCSGVSGPGSAWWN
jgi:ATP-dependent exoDNAse (exonuclease V) alpha subunit